MIVKGNAMALNVFPEVTMAQQCFAFDLRKI